MSSDTQAFYNWWDSLPSSERERLEELENKYPSYIDDYYWGKIIGLWPYEERSSKEDIGSKNERASRSGPEKQRSTTGPGQQIGGGDEGLLWVSSDS